MRDRALRDYRLVDIVDRMPERIAMRVVAGHVNLAMGLLPKDIPCASTTFCWTAIYDEMTAQGFKPSVDIAPGTYGSPICGYIRRRKQTL